MENNQYDVIIIGAGAAGLMAAWELAMVGRKVAVLEARDRIGGRINTVFQDKFEMPVELGAEFVHGNLEPSLSFLERAGISYYEVTGEPWMKEDGRLKEQQGFIEDYSLLKKKFKELKQDISVADFIGQYLQGEKFEDMRFTLKNYVEGYYAADAAKASTYALKEELTKGDDEQYRLEGGYINLADFIYEQARRKGAQFFLSSPVKQVSWETAKITIKAGGSELWAQKLLVTVPIGILQQEKITFSPALPQITAAARKLGFGPVVKTVLQFDEAFWKNRDYTSQKNMKKLGFLFSQEVVPTWWTYYPKNVAMLCGWSAGRHASEIQHLSEKEILQKALTSLSNIFGLEAGLLQNKLRGWQVCNWQNDPYSCGAYSYEVVGGAAAKAVLKQSVADTIYFAGEGLIEGPEIGTVNAALRTGQETAHTMIASFKSTR